MANIQDLVQLAMAFHNKQLQDQQFAMQQKQAMLSMLPTVGTMIENTTDPQAKATMISMLGNVTGIPGDQLTTAFGKEPPTVERQQAQLAQQGAGSVDPKQAAWRLLVGVGMGEGAKDMSVYDAFNNIKQNFTPDQQAQMQREYVTNSMTGMSQGKAAMDAVLATLPPVDLKRAVRGSLGLELLDPDLSRLNLQDNYQKEQIKLSYQELNLRRMLGLDDSAARDLTLRLNYAQAFMAGNQKQSGYIMDNAKLVKDILDQLTKNRGNLNPTEQAAYAIQLDEALKRMGFPGLTADALHDVGMSGIMNSVHTNLRGQRPTTIFQQPTQPTQQPGTSAGLNNPFLNFPMPPALNIPEYKP